MAPRKATFVGSIRHPKNSKDNPTQIIAYSETRGNEASKTARKVPAPDFGNTPYQQYTQRNF